MSYASNVNANAGMMLPESTPEREELRDKVWDAWNQYVDAITERQRKALRKRFHQAAEELAGYDAKVNENRRMKQERSNPLGRKDNAWWDVTWNPITGCTRVSPGCQHCYAHNQYDRFPVVIHGLGVGTYDCPYDREPIPFSALVFHADRLSLPLHWKKPRRVFVCSMSDFLHEQVRPEWLAQMWTVFSTCQQHSFYLLTKRPENAPAKMAGLPTLPNVHIGVTVESYEYERRIDLLGDIPGGSFVSVEPMLSAVIRVMPPYVTWVICGAETGPSARPIDLDMAYRLRRQCADAGIPFWFKSAGRGVTIPEDLDVMEVPNAK